MTLAESQDARLADLLGRLEARLDRLESKVDAIARPLETLSRTGPVVVDAAAQVAQRAVDAATQAGVDPAALYGMALPIALRLAQPETLALAERLTSPEALALAGRLTEPDALALVGRLLDRSGGAAKMLDRLDVLEARLSGAGVDVEALSARGIDVAVQLAGVAQGPEVTALVASGPLEKEALDVVGKSAAALVETRREAPAPVGLFGALMKMGDPDVKRAVGFGLEFARRFGRLLGA